MKRLIAIARSDASKMAGFACSPASAAVYQLGPFGTAVKKLKEWDSKR